VWQEWHLPGIDADVLAVWGRESDKMARHYPCAACKFAAANLITKYSLAGSINQFR
jgi:hypothetical protein